MPDEQLVLFISPYLDADLSYELAEILRQEGFEAVSAWDLGQQG